MMDIEVPVPRMQVPLRHSSSMKSPMSTARPPKMPTSPNRVPMSPLLTMPPAPARDPQPEPEPLREAPCTPRVDDLRRQLHAKEQDLETAKLQIQELELKLALEAKQAAAAKSLSLTPKKTHAPPPKAHLLISPGMKKKKNRRSRERLILSASVREQVNIEMQKAEAPPLVSLVDEAAAAGRAEEATSSEEDGWQLACGAARELDDHGSGQRRFCAPGRWVHGLLRALSTGQLHDARSDGAAAQRGGDGGTGKWTEGDDIEYLAVDVVKGEKTMKWVRGRVAAVRSRVVRDAARRELRVTYYSNSRHQETTYWMVPSDLRLRVPRS